MRGLLILLPALLIAQAPPPKAGAARPAAGARPAGTAKPPAPKPAATAKPPAPLELTTDDEKAVYAVGLTMYRQLAQLDLSPAEMEIVKRALADAVANKPLVELSEWSPKVQPFAIARGARVKEREKAASAVYLAKAAAEPGAVKSESGMIYREVRPGTGESPKATDTVKVNYRGTLINGTEFDSSYKRNEPAQFALNAVIKCWTEGVQKIKTGGKSVLICPSDLAYGDQGRPSIPGGATLIFEIELLEIVAAGK
jgi:FKBP-type peptidyl-prolyl cis-trans isomerase FkpA